MSWDAYNTAETVAAQRDWLAEQLAQLTGKSPEQLVQESRRAVGSEDGGEYDIIEYTPTRK